MQTGTEGMSYLLKLLLSKICVVLLSLVYSIGKKGIEDRKKRWKILSYSTMTNVG